MVRKDKYTIVACANAIGQAILVFHAKNFKHTWTKNEVPRSKYGVSDKGWINTDLFQGWPVIHFVLNTVPGQQRLLLLD